MVLSDEQVRERDGNRCARCGKTGSLHVHHRWMRSAGDDETGCNRVTLCAWCHGWAHHNPSQAVDEGWLVSRYADPAQVQVRHVLWPTWPVLLEAEGGITPVIPDE